MKLKIKATDILKCQICSKDKALQNFTWLTQENSLWILIQIALIQEKLLRE